MHTILSRKRLEVRFLGHQLTGDWQIQHIILIIIVATDMVPVDMQVTKRLSLTVHCRIIRSRDPVWCQLHTYSHTRFSCMPLWAWRSLY